MNFILLLLVFRMKLPQITLTSSKLETSGKIISMISNLSGWVC